MPRTLKEEHPTRRSGRIIASNASKSDIAPSQASQSEAPNDKKSRNVTGRAKGAGITKPKPKPKARPKPKQKTKPKAPRKNARKEAQLAQIIEESLSIDERVQHTSSLSSLQQIDSLPPQIAERAEETVQVPTYLTPRVSPAELNPEETGVDANAIAEEPSSTQGFTTRTSPLNPPQSPSTENASPFVSVSSAPIKAEATLAVPSSPPSASASGSPAHVTAGVSPVHASSSSDPRAFGSPTSAKIEAKKSLAQSSPSSSSAFAKHIGPEADVVPAIGTPAPQIVASIATPSNLPLPDSNGADILWSQPPSDISQPSPSWPSSGPVPHSSPYEPWASYRPSPTPAYQSASSSLGSDRTFPTSSSQFACPALNLNRASPSLSTHRAYPSLSSHLASPSLSSQLGQLGVEDKVSLQAPAQQFQTQLFDGIAFSPAPESVEQDDTDSVDLNDHDSGVKPRLPSHFSDVNQVFLYARRFGPSHVIKKLTSKQKDQVIKALFKNDEQVEDLKAELAMTKRQRDEAIQRSRDNTRLRGAFFHDRIDEKRRAAEEKEAAEKAAAEKNAAAEREKASLLIPGPSTVSDTAVMPPSSHVHTLTRVARSPASVQQLASATSAQQLASTASAQQMASTASAQVLESSPHHSAQSPSSMAQPPSASRTPRRTSLIGRLLSNITSPFMRSGQSTPPTPRAEDQSTPSAPLGELPVSRKRSAAEISQQPAIGTMQPTPAAVPLQSAQPASHGFLTPQPQRRRQSKTRIQSAMKGAGPSSLQTIRERPEDVERGFKAPSPTPKRRTLVAARAARQRAAQAQIPKAPRRAWETQPEPPRLPNADVRLEKLERYKRLGNATSAMDDDDDIKDIIGPRVKRVKVSQLAWVPHNRPGDPEGCFRAPSVDSDDEMEVDESVPLRQNIFSSSSLMEKTPPAKQGSIQKDVQPSGGRSPKPAPKVTATPVPETQTAKVSKAKAAVTATPAAEAQSATVSKPAPAVSAIPASKTQAAKVSAAQIPAAQASKSETSQAPSVAAQHQSAASATASSIRQTIMDPKAGQRSPSQNAEGTGSDGASGFNFPYIGTRKPKPDDPEEIADCLARFERGFEHWRRTGECIDCFGD